jgi:hypothetical protein
MNRSSLAGVVLVLGAACLLGGVFGRPLGLPDGSGSVLSVVAIALMLFGFSLERSAKASGEPPTVAPAVNEHRKRLRLSLILVILASLTSPLWLPYTGLRLTMLQSVIVAVVSCILSAGAVIFGARNDREKV